MNKRKLIISYLILFLAGVIGDVLAQGVEFKDAGWEVEKRGEQVYYFTHGMVVWRNEFGFIKGDDCRSDILWLTFSSPLDRVKDFEGKEVVILLKVDERDFKIRLPMHSTNTSGSTTVMEFTNWRPSKQLMDALVKGSFVKVQILEPKELEELLDSKEDQFSLRVFTASRKQAEQLCKDKDSGMDWIK